MAIVPYSADQSRPDVVLQVLAGESDALPVGAALGLAATIDAPVAQLADLIGGLLRSATDPVVRSGAAVALRRLGTVEVRPGLRAAIAREQDDRVTSRIATGLGMLGDEEDIELLMAAVSRARSPVTNERITFAAALVACRLGVPGPGLPTPPVEIHPSPGSATAPVITGQPTDEDLVVVLDGLRAEPIGFSARPDLISRIDCGQRPVYIVLNPLFVDSVADLHARRALLGVAVDRFVEPPSASLAMLILTTPADNGFDILVARMRGEPLYAGSGDTDTTRITGRLTAVDAIGVAAAEVTFTLDQSQLEVNGTTEKAIRRRQEPIPARLDPIR